MLQLHFNTIFGCDECGSTGYVRHLNGRSRDLAVGWIYFNQVWMATSFVLEELAHASVFPVRSDDINAAGDIVK